MKKFFSVLFCVIGLMFMLSSNASAGWEGEGFYTVAGGNNVHYFNEEPGNPNITFLGNGGEGGVGDVNVDNKNSNINTNANSNKNENTNVNLVGASADNKNIVDNKISMNIVNERDLLAAPSVPSTEPTFLQSGKFFDYTYFVTDFYGVTKYNHKLHIAIRILEKRDGYWFWRWRLEDVDDLVMEAKEKYPDVTWCYRVIGKDSSVNGTTGGGIAGSTSGSDGAATGSILPSLSRLTYNPEIIFYVYDCMNRPEKAKVEQIEVK